MTFVTIVPMVVVLVTIYSFCSAETYDVLYVTKYDDTIGNLMLNNVDLYLNGQLDKDAAIAQFKDDVASNYRRLDVE